MANHNECIFCGNQADTREHIIPRWLQNHFDLFDQKLQLSNGTLLPYRQAMVPACSFCNNERFGKLEKKIREQSANHQEYYIWALKLRYSLAMRDSSLLFDRSDPSQGSLIPLEMAKFRSEFILPVFRSLDNPDFKYNPSPFGSVIILDQNPKMHGTFDLVDVPPPYWAISLVLPGNKLLAVLFADRGIIKRIGDNSIWGENFSRLSNVIPDLNAQYLLFFLLRLQNQFYIPRSVFFSENEIVSEPIPDKLKIRKQKVKWYFEIANYCGFDDKVAKLAFEEDRKWVKFFGA